MTSVLTFLGWLFSVIGSSYFQTDTQTHYQSIIEFSKIIKQGSYQLINGFKTELDLKGSGIFVPHLISSVLLAIIILIFLDWLIGRFFNRLKV
jgi:tryptophanyl-tRNA synthetase